MNVGGLLLSKFVTAALLGALGRAALRRAPTTFEGDPVLAHGRVVGGIAFVSVVVMPATIGWLWYWQPPRDPVGERNAIGVLAFFLGIGLPIGWDWLRFRCVLTGRGFDYRSAWTGSRFVPLEDVVSLTYGGMSGCFILTSRDGRRHRISPYVTGIREFADFCRRHLPRDVWKSGLDGFDAIAAGRI